MEAYRLTDKDRRILYELSLDGRASITEIARRAGLSKQVVSYRIDLLEKNNVILGYHAITNIYMLGKTHYRVFLKLQNMSAEKEDEFVAYLKNHPKIVWIASLEGYVDCAYLVWADNISEFEAVYDEIDRVWGTYFQEKQLSIATRIEYLKHSYLTEAEDAHSIVFGDCYEHHALDALDKALLGDLTTDARVSLVELANRHGMSAKAIKKRIDDLIAKRIIIGFNAKINHTLLGFTHRKISLNLNDVSQPTIDRLSGYLRSNPNVIFLVKPIGGHDFEFEIMTETNEAFHALVKDLRSRFADEIKDLGVFIIYSEPKSGQLQDY
ncbi:Lrp/AsnC family transcriptional regulator [Candidatus Woesearchaeota archaeon]|nr:Lrp/AsnC family transcriptional regulator [Candidatus Woesearchaeota archaeon]